VSVLCYHSVDDSWANTLVVSPADFEAQCAWLARHRRVVDLPEAIEKLDGRGRLPRGFSCITFDDGYEALYHYAWPALRKHGLPATVFVVAETLTDAGRTVDWIDEPPEVPPTTLSLEQMLEMQEAGVGFESHSYSHHDLTTLSAPECTNDLTRSRTLLEDKLGKSVRYLAYPRGRHNAVVRRAAVDAGYEAAVSLPEVYESPGRYSIPRVGVYPGNGLPTLRLKTSPFYLGLRTSKVWPAAKALVKRGASKT
jgi:peptidoglycan/xylan/chitin deacetylase (PgdA/CDA1 family)